MKTPLFSAHVALGARMAPFGGWDMPIQYQGILVEHAYTRTEASVFDTCHMGEFALSGPTAEVDLERLVTQRVASLKVGQCRYGYLLREDGGVLDDLTVYRKAADQFWLIVNAGTRLSDAAWIREHLSPQTRFVDISDGTAKLDIQGPRSRAELEKAVGARLPDLNYFWFAETELLGLPCTISRTGYTGEWGYEIYFPAEHAARFWETLLERSRIRPAGLGARDTLRLEVAYPLYGHELDTSRTPVAAARGAFLDLGKDFVGRQAVQRDLDQGCSHYLVGLQLDSKRAARAHDKVMHDGRAIGEITSGSLAPSLGAAVAFAYVEAAYGAPGTTLQVEVHGKGLSARVVELPFYRQGTARAK